MRVRVCACVCERERGGERKEKHQFKKITVNFLVGVDRSCQQEVLFKNLFLRKLSCSFFLSTQCFNADLMGHR